MGPKVSSERQHSACIILHGLESMHPVARALKVVSSFCQKGLQSILFLVNNITFTGFEIYIQNNENANININKYLLIITLMYIIKMIS